MQPENSAFADAGQQLSAAFRALAGRRAWAVSRRSDMSSPP